MKIFSWNVNGFRAVLKKGFGEWFKNSDADVLCLQEIKAREDQIPHKDRSYEGYDAVFHPANVKKGYSGVAVYFKRPPLDIVFGLPQNRFQGEGRLIQLEYDTFYLCNVYVPNGQMSEERLRYKLDYCAAFLDYTRQLRRQKSVVVCGDFNTAHKEIDLKNPKANEKISGFLPIEREWLDNFIASGFVDTFRVFNQGPGHYSWWSYRFGARSRNAGWRIDYIFISSEMRDGLRGAWIEKDVMGSDHCPIGVDLF